MPSKLFAAFLLSLLLSSAAAAAEAPCNPPGPNREQVMQWKKDFVDRFETVFYLDDKEQPMTQDAFLRAIYEKHMAFSLLDEARDGKLDGKTLKLRLLPALVQRKCG